MQTDLNLFYEKYFLNQHNFVILLERSGWWWSYVQRMVEIHLSGISGLRLM